MERALARYLRHHRTLGSTDKTLAYHKDSIGGLVAYLRGQGHSLTLEALTLDDVEGWIDDQRKRGLSQKTISTRVISVKAFTHWLVEAEWLDKDPLKRLRPPKVDDKPKEVLSAAEVDAVLKAIDRATVTGARDFAMLLLLYSTGIRAEELLQIRHGDLDWAAGLVMIRRGKGGKFRVVPLTGKAERAVDKYLSHPKRKDLTPDDPKRQAEAFVFLNQTGEPLPYQGLKMVFRRLEARTGIHCNAHKWRHSAAVAYLRQGGKVEALKAMLGHTSLDMTLHYARLAGVDLTEAHQTADPARGLRTKA